MRYSQVTFAERCCIAETLEGEPDTALSEIARRLNRSKSTISDEVRRNSLPCGRYLASAAEELAKARKHSPRGAYKKDNPTILEAIETGLQKKWSPEIIAAQLKEDHPRQRANWASHQTIYELIWEDRAHGGTWFKGLPHSGRKRRKRYGSTETRGQIPNRTGIEERPSVVDRKRRVGDWEGDTIRGCNGGGGLASFVERKTQYVVLDLLEDGTAAELNRVARRAFSRHTHAIRRTLTVDNGKEFSEHEQLARDLDISVYFARPYRSCDRGLNEQINGMVRWWFPKGTDFTKVRQIDVRRVEYLLNTRPRKTQRYQSPDEAMRQASVRLQI